MAHEVKIEMSPANPDAACDGDISLNPVSAGFRYDAETRSMQLSIRGNGHCYSVQLGGDDAADAATLLLAGAAALSATSRR